MKQRYSNFDRVGGVGNGSQRRRRAREPQGFLGQVVAGAAFVAIVSWNLAPEAEAVWATATLSPAELAQTESSVYYAGCDEARSAGVAPLHRGSPGYREGMDGDGDGVACEPYY